MTAGEALLDELLDAPASARRRLADRVLREGLAWDAWSQRFRAAYLERPERAEGAATALAESAEASGRHDVLGRLLGQRAVALHRTGSPTDAARLYREAADHLVAAGHPDDAAHARLLAVDALAHAGQLDDALAEADALARVLRGARHRLRRALLRGNRASALRLAGRLEESARESEAASRSLEQLGQEGSAAAAELNAGVAWMYAGRLEKAGNRLRSAARRLEALGQADRVEDARYDLACLDVRAGRLGPAVRSLDALARDFAARGLVRRAALARMDLADALGRLGDDDAAAREARMAADAFEAERAPGEAAEAWLLLAQAEVAVNGGPATETLDAARRAAELSSREEIALRIAVLADDVALAAGTLPSMEGMARRAARANELGLREVADATRTQEAERLLLHGDAVGARARLEEHGLLRRTHPFAVVRAARVDARAAAALGDTSAAISGLRRVTTRLAAWAGDVPGGWLASAFLARHGGATLDLVDLLLVRGRAVDRSEAVARLDELARQAFAVDTSPPRARGLMALRQRLESIYATLAGGGGARGLGLAARPALVEEARRLEQDVLRRWRDEERQTASLAPTREPPVANDAFDVIAHLWHHGGRLRATLSRRSGEVLALPALAADTEVRRATEAVRFHAERVRQMGSRAARDVLDDELELLANRVLLPMVEALGELPASWGWIADPRASALPLEHLPLEGRPLAACVPMARVPALHAAPRARPRGRGEAAVLLAADDLPGARDEVRALGHAAAVAPTREGLARALARHRVVHVAGHGYTPDDAPALGGLRLADGWFTSADVPSRVGADLVVLAACRSGTGTASSKRPVGGLPRALLAAGARQVLWTAADVDDAASARLMTAFHTARKRLGTAAALGEALILMQDQEGTPARSLPFRLTGFQP
ncbi:MAG: CHAT domain-containing protein [Planctomycetota bacterium]